MSLDILPFSFSPNGVLRKYALQKSLFWAHLFLCPYENILHGPLHSGSEGYSLGIWLGRNSSEGAFFDLCFGRRVSPVQRGLCRFVVPMVPVAIPVP
jgi:hypothetical protein